MPEWVVVVRFVNLRFLLQPITSRLFVPHAGKSAGSHHEDGGRDSFSPSGRNEEMKKRRNDSNLFAGSSSVGAKQKQTYAIFN